MPSVFASLAHGYLPDGYPIISIPQPDLCFALEEPFHWAEMYIILLLFSLPVLFFIAAPYGKLKGSTWTVDVSPWWSWFIMESPAFVVHLLLSFSMLPQIIQNVQKAYAYYHIPDAIQQNQGAIGTGNLFVPPQINLYVVSTIISALLYNGHYIYRSIIYPSLTKSIKNNDLFPVLLAAVFNCANGLVQAVGMYCHTPRDVTHLNFPLYVIGHIGFMLAWYGCFWSDMYLVSLRNTNTNTNRLGLGSKAHYTVPKQGLFKYTYSANYFCEFFQWIFFALMVPFSPERWLFVALTFCNLFPRAYQYRRFYVDLERSWP